MKLVQYILFAVIATLINIATQKLSHSVYTGYLSLYIGLSAGTLSGLVSKYLLDKQFVFKYKGRGNTDNFRKFMLYALMGLFTTVIFWGFELGFDLAFQDPNAKYWGGILGLGIGYMIKYFLDKNYVFTNDPPIFKSQVHENK